MTGTELKTLLEQLTAGYLSGHLNRELLTEETGDSLQETLNVLDEILPGMTPEAVKQALTASADGHSLREIRKQARKLDRATVTEFEERAAEMMDMLLTNLNLSELQLRPSVLYRD